MEQKLKFECRITLTKGCELATEAVVTVPMGTNKAEVVQDLKEQIAEYCSKGKFQFTADDVKVKQIF